MTKFNKFDQVTCEFKFLPPSAQVPLHNYTRWHWIKDNTIIKKPLFDQAITLKSTFDQESTRPSHLQHSCHAGSNFHPFIQSIMIDKYFSIQSSIHPSIMLHFYIHHFITVGRGKALVPRLSKWYLFLGCAKSHVDLPNFLFQPYLVTLGSARPAVTSLRCTIFYGQD